MKMYLDYFDDISESQQNTPQIEEETKEPQQTSKRVTFQDEKRDKALTNAFKKTGSAAEDKMFETIKKWQGGANDQSNTNYWLRSLDE